MGPSELPRPGDIVSGKYRIDSVIGQGGMGVVLGAVDQSLGRPVAIKFLTPARAASPAAATRFDREARAAASIRSEHVVGIYEVGALPGGSPFIVMERLAGSDLSDVVAKRGGLPVDFACDLILQTCSALADAHARGIVHRDLKPQNLFLTTRNDGSPCLKVLDFGISKTDDADGSSPKLTSTDMVMGTPLYMSPEQVRSLKNVDARADIWALGAILQELLTASPPFDGPTASALHAAIAMDLPASVRDKRPDVSLMIEAIILRCLEKDPARRFQSVAELADALAPHATDRGRESARSVVRNAPAIIVPSMPPGPPAGGFGMASTMEVRSKPSYVVPPPNATTAGSWQQGSAMTPRSSAGPVIAILAAVFGAVVIGAGVIGFLVFRSEAKQNVTVTVANQPPAMQSIAPPPPVTVPTTTASVPVTPAAHPTSTAKAKDAGAPPVAVKDAGAAPNADDQAKLHAQQMQGLCDHHQFLMSPTLDDATRKNNAQNAKIMDCFRIDAVRCERDVCKTACGILNDTDCQRREADIERMSPAKY